MKTMEDKLLTVDEVASYLGVRPETVRNWIRDKSITAVRLPKGVYRIRKSELDRLLSATNLDTVSSETPEPESEPEHEL